MQTIGSKRGSQIFSYTGNKRQNCKIIRETVDYLCPSKILWELFSYAFFAKEGEWKILLVNLP